MNVAAAIGDQPVSRGGRKRDRDGPERRCIATGESGSTDLLIRFVVSPDGEAVPDVAGKLPGRGAWLTADRLLVQRAVTKRLFSRGFRQQVRVAEDLPDRLEELLARRLIEGLSMARKAGQLVTGAEKVRARITGGTTSMLLQAHDGAADGIAKIARLADAVSGGQIARIGVLSSSELGLAFGRDYAVHAALDQGGFTARVRVDAARLSGFRAVEAPQRQTVVQKPSIGPQDGSTCTVNSGRERAINGASNKDDT
ncbi:MAG: RNA-binding protein [Pseudomonadota bacterium]